MLALNCPLCTENPNICFNKCVYRRWRSRNEPCRSGMRVQEQSVESPSRKYGMFMKGVVLISLRDMHARSPRPSWPKALAELCSEEHVDHSGRSIVLGEEGVEFVERVMEEQVGRRWSEDWTDDEGGEEAEEEAFDRAFLRSMLAPHDEEEEYSGEESESAATADRTPELTDR